MKRVLAFGSGVDSSAILIHSLFVKSLNLDLILFSDTGNESKKTYLTLKRMKALAESHGVPFEIVRHKKESIVEWCLRLGIVPLLPGGDHVCSIKFKAEVMERFVKKRFPDEQIVFLIGIAKSEERRIRRFSAPKDGLFSYEYPLIDLQMTREDCVRLLTDYGYPGISKSACGLCPFNTVSEIIAVRNNPKQWEIIKEVERKFQETSPKKHKAWLDAGQPLRSNNTSPAGMWRRDSWARGNRLFAKRINGRQLSVLEWQDLIDKGEADQYAQ